jgi:hypothetical protein
MLARILLLTELDPFVDRTRLLYVIFESSRTILLVLAGVGIMII